MRGRAMFRVRRFDNVTVELICETCSALYPVRFGSLVSVRGQRVRVTCPNGHSSNIPGIDCAHITADVVAAITEVSREKAERIKQQPTNLDEAIVEVVCEECCVLYQVRFGALIVERGRKPIVTCPIGHQTLMTGFLRSQVTPHVVALISEVSRSRVYDICQRPW